MFDPEQEIHGTVKRVFYTKGFGFIEGDDSREYFFHVYELRATFERLALGDRVKFFAEPRSFKNKNGEQVEGWKALRVRFEEAV